MPRFAAASPRPIAARPAEGPGASDPARVVDLTALAAAGRPWDAPSGRWRIDVFTAHELADTDPGSFRRNYLDLLDDEAVDRLDHLLDGIPQKTGAHALR